MRLSTVVRSVSLYGLSSVTLTFDRGTDRYFARQQVFERLPDAELVTLSGESHLGGMLMAEEVLGRLVATDRPQTRS